jgi:hypothetical protein
MFKPWILGGSNWPWVYTNYLNLRSVKCQVRSDKGGLVNTLVQSTTMSASNEIHLFKNHEIRLFENDKIHIFERN